MTSTLSKKILFYITIVENNKTDHSFLRTIIHKVVPHAIVDSVYDDDEAVQYFNNCPALPHLIFLEQGMLNVSGRNTLELIKRIEGLDQVPIVLLTNDALPLKTSSKQQQAGEYYYSKPFEAQNLVNIVGSLNSKWVA